MSQLQRIHNVWIGVEGLGLPVEAVDANYVWGRIHCSAVRMAVVAGEGRGERKKISKYYKVNACHAVLILLTSSFGLDKLGRSFVTA